MSRPPVPSLSAVPFPCGKLRQEPSAPSLEEQVRELEKKLFWLKDENAALRKLNSSLRTQISKHYRA